MQEQRPAQRLMGICEVWPVSKVLNTQPAPVKQPEPMGVHLVATPDTNSLAGQVLRTRAQPQTSKTSDKRKRHRTPEERTCMRFNNLLKLHTIDTQPADLINNLLNIGRVIMLICPTGTTHS